MATITKRGDRQWQVKVRKRGYPTETKTFPTKAKAEQWARAVESEMDKGIFVSTTAAEETTLAELFDRYEREVVPTKKSQAAIKSRIKIVTAMIGFYSVAALTPRILAASGKSRRRPTLTEGGIGSPRLSRFLAVPALMCIRALTCSSVR